MSATPASASNTRLVAILLVTQSRVGTHIAYHYPAVPAIRLLAHNRRGPDWYGTPGNLSDFTDSSDEEDSGSDHDNPTNGQSTGVEKADSHGSRGKGSGGKPNQHGSVKSSRQKQGSAEDVLDEEMPQRLPHRMAIQNRLQHDFAHRDNVRRRGPPEWETLFGFSADGLAKLLSPHRTFDKRRFEVAVDQLVFLGSPRFVREDGFWKKQRKSKRKEPLTGSGDSASTETDAAKSGKSWEKVIRDVPIFEAGYGHAVSGAASVASTESAEEPELFMFNLVFVLHPPSLEHSERVEDMYDNVAKRFAKALKYSQAESGFVTKEVQQILALKDDAREEGTPMSILWPQISKTSQLARTIMVTFDAIYNEKVAHINLGLDIDASFQIPRPASTAFPPTPMRPQLPGLWLTTVEPMDEEDSEMALANFALLLLEDKQVLLDEVTRDAKELSAPLAHFIEYLTPTKSLKKVAAMCKMSLNDVQLLAKHLIFWRRGRAVPPLRPMDYYIVSPNADLKSLPSAMTQFAAKFPNLPTLPKLLHSLSGAPRPYAGLIPNKTYREKYMDILAWLLRYGWVTQLRTFAWIHVTPEIKAAAAAKAELDAKRQAQFGSDSTHSSNTARAAGSPNTLHAPSTFHLHGYGEHDHAPFSPSTLRSTSLASNASPLLLGRSSGPPSDAGSEHTIVHKPSAHHLLSSAHDSIRSPSPSLSLSMSRASPALSSSSAQVAGLAINRTLDLHSPTASELGHGNSPHTTTSSGILHAAPAAASAAKAASDGKPSIIANPQHASDDESRWIEAIGETLKLAVVADEKKGLGGSQKRKAKQPRLKDLKDKASKDKGGRDGEQHTDEEESMDLVASDLAGLWPDLLQYFDGKHALEDISVREGIKKKRVVELIQRLVNDRFLITVRHW